MARIQYSSLINNITGSIGSVTFQKNNAGTMVRSRSSSKPRNSTKLNGSQNKHLYFLNQWSNLTGAEKADWNSYAQLFYHQDAYGQSRWLTGLNWFESINYNRAYFSLPLVTSPPAHANPNALSQFGVILSETQILIRFQDSVIVPDQGLLIYSTSPIRGSSPQQRKLLRFTTPTDFDTSLDIDITSAWNLAHGLKWGCLNGYSNLNIAVLIKPVNLLSGVSFRGISVNADSNQATAGIGFWKIGSTFVVS